MRSGTATDSASAQTTIANTAARRVVDSPNVAAARTVLLRSARPALTGRAGLPSLGLRSLCR